MPTQSYWTLLFLFTTIGHHRRTEDYARLAPSVACGHNGAMRPNTRPPETVTASEIANWVYCAEAWGLGDGLKLPPSNQAARNAGTVHHARKATAERVAGGFIAAGRLLTAVTILALLAIAAYLAFTQR